MSLTEHLPEREIPDDFVCECAGRRWWKRRPRGTQWIQTDEKAVYGELMERGYDIKGRPNSEADKVRRKIMEKYQVSVALALAGMRAGIKSFNGRTNILITDDSKRVTPVKGSWDTIKKVLTNLLVSKDKADPAGTKQLDVFHSWMKIALEDQFAEVTSISGQALALAGPPACGKSFVQHRIITPIMGGEGCRPNQYMTGGTTFNEDLASAGHWILEDESSSTDGRSRRAFGNQLKSATVNQDMRVHGKGAKAVMVQLKCRVSISLNDEPDNLSGLPLMDPSIVDKIHLLRCFKSFDNASSDLNARAALETAIAEEIPGYAYWLLNEFQIPEELRDPRFGVLAYVHPVLKLSMEELQDETELWEYIQYTFFSGNQQEHTLTASEIHATLTAPGAAFEKLALKLLPRNNTCGTLLRALSHSHPELVEKSGAKKWLLKRPKS